MAGIFSKKRSRDDAPKSKPVRPSKKQRKQAQAAYHSSSEEESDNEQKDNSDGGDDFQAVNLLDSDEDDIHNAQVDDGAASEASTSDDSDAGNRAAPPRKATKKRPSIAKDAPKNALAKDAPSSDSNPDTDGEEDDDEVDEYSDLEDDNPNYTKQRKRNDPEAFATSLSKILSTKLSTSRRADPVLARSAEAQAAGRAAVDTALETKARRRLRDQKRLAMEKGRVRDVLVATSNEVAVGQTTAGVLETERRLRKVAQRGVVQLFNAFRTAQVKAAEAERTARKEGVVGVDRKKEKVVEMSKKGFLDLIAAGGGGLKKGPLEEA